jgi:hexosaminidase
MKKNLVLTLLAVFGCLTAAGQVSSSQITPLRIIPTPQQSTATTESFKLTSQTRIILGDRSGGSDRFAAQQINGWLLEQRKAPLRVTDGSSLKKIPRNIIYLGSPQDSFGKRWLKSRKMTFSPEMREEGYILESNRDQIVILGESDRGRLYGVMTLLQLLGQQKKSVVVPGVEIRDWPQQSLRGITDDLSRGQISTMENFKKIIRFLARHKLNVYSPYIEDIFVFKSHPEIGKGRGDLTAAEVKELDAFARQYHVELIPIFETLGHWENILSLPQYRQYAEFPGAHTVNVSDEAVYTLLDNMIGELCAAFSSPHFNMAADESWDVGLGANKARVAASDLATVHAEHYKRLFGIIRKYKKKPMMYGDIILNNPTILDKIPKDVVIVDWHYGALEQYPSPAVFKAAGVPFVVSPAVWNFTGPFPNYINTVINILNLNRDGFRNGSLGLLTSNWNDYGGEALRELNYYGYAWTAECAWRPLGASVAHFDSTFFRQFFRDDRAALAGQAAYAWLSNPLNQVNWNELWRHPMLPVSQSNIPMIWREQSLAATIPLVQETLSDLKANLKNNPEQVRLLSFVARLSSWYAQKLEAAENLKRAVQDTTAGSAKQAEIQAALRQARSVVNGLSTLRDEFKSLWLETNRSPSLNLLMMRYDRQIQYWEETIRAVERSGIVQDPLIESQWIYHPQANPGRLDSSVSQVPEACYRKVFSLSEPVSGARLQLIGDTHAQVWVNGVEVGEVFARRSLSLLVEHQRIRMWDVTPLLKPGDNVIAVEVANYNTFGSAGFNLYGELRGGSVTTKILSDSTWKVSPQAPEEWRSVKFDDHAWLRAVPKLYPFQVIQPDFDTGRLSWIER